MVDGEVPVCPRHPDQVSYVRCQRCERPVCPQCQREAAVGVQCVDCVREGARTQPTARTVFGGTVGTRPLVTRAIIASCVVVYLLQILPGSLVTAQLQFVPFLAETEPWRFLTAAFVHAPTLLPLHIGFNMYALWLLGPYLEGLLGQVRFLAVYLVSALGGSVAYLVLADPQGRSWFVGTVGASGAVFGLFAAVVAINRKLRRDSQAIIGVMAINLVIGFLPGLNIAWQAHVGGLVTGGVVAGLLAAVPAGPRRSVLQLLGVGAVVAALVVLSVLKLAVAPTA